MSESIPNHADRTLYLLQELEHDYENIMGLRTNPIHNHPDYESVVGLRPGSNNTHYTLEDEIAYLHERIDQIHRNQVHNRIRSNSTSKRTTDTGCQTEQNDNLCNGIDFQRNGHSPRNTRRHNETTSTNRKPGDRFNADRKLPCQFCGGSGLGISHIPENVIPFLTSPQSTTTNKDNKRHISWAFVDTSQSQPQVSHIYLELSSSPLESLQEQHGSQQSCSPKDHHKTKSPRTRYQANDDTDSKASCSESELEQDYSQDSGDSNAARTASESDDYVTLKRSHFTQRYPSFGTSIEFADFEDNCNGSGDQDGGEVSPFVSFVSKIDKTQQQVNFAPNTSKISRPSDQKRILKPSYKQLHRQATPGPSTYANGLPSDDDDHEYVDLDLRDPELQEAAVKMQAAFKGFSARKKLGLKKTNKIDQTNKPKESPKSPDGERPRRKLIEPEIVVRAATPLNTKPNDNNYELADIDLNDPELASAATKMQAAFKGFHARRKMKKKNAEPAPSFEEEMFIEISEDSTSIRLKCKLSTTKPPPKISWLHDSVVMKVDSSTDQRVWCAQDKDGYCMLTLYDVDDDDSGVYTCKAKFPSVEVTTTGEFHCYEDSITASDDEECMATSSEEDSTSSGEYQGELVIGGEGPQFTFAPQSRVVERGMTAKFICSVTGSPTPEVKWFTRGSLLQTDGVKYTTYTSTDDELGQVSVLEINFADDSDAGEYVCTATNEDGQIFSHAELSLEEYQGTAQYQYVEDRYGRICDIYGFELEQNQATNPRPYQILSETGTAAKFHSTFSGQSRPIVTWLKDNACITSTDHVVHYEGEDSFGLELTSLQPGDAGLYTCLSYAVEEDIEREICSFQLVVLDCEDSKTKPADSIPLLTPTFTDITEEDEPMDDMQDSGYSQAPSSNISQTDGYPEALNGNAEHNNTCSKMELGMKEEVIVPKTAGTMFTEKPSHQGNGMNGIHSSEDEQDLRLQSAEQIKVDSKRQDSSKEKRMVRRHSSPNTSKLKSTSDQKEGVSRKRRDRRKGSQPSDHEKKPTHRPSYDSNMNKSPKTLRRNRYGSLPSKLDEFDNSFNKISRLNSRVDSCLSLVDSVLELNSSVYDQEHEDSLKAKLREMSLCLSDTALSDENVLSGGDDDSKQNAGIKTRHSISISSSDGIDDKEPPATKQNNLEVLTTDAKPHEQSIVNPNITMTDEVNLITSTEDAKQNFRNKTEIFLFDAAEVEAYHYGDTESGSELEGLRPRLDTVVEETEGSEDILENTNNSNDSRLLEINVNGENLKKEVVNEPQIVRSSVAIPLQSAPSTLIENDEPMQKGNYTNADPTVPFQSTPLPLHNPGNLISTHERPLDEDSTALSPVPTNLRTPSPVPRKLSVDELDALPESAIDTHSQSSSPAGSPVRNTKRYMDDSTYAQDLQNGDTQNDQHVNHSDPTNMYNVKDETWSVRHEPLRFTQLLKDTLVLDGDALRLEVRISGSPVPEVTWYKGLKELAHEHCEMTYDRNDRWSLVIRKVAREDEGEYLCKASNGRDVISSTCFLVVRGLFGTSTDESDGTSISGNHSTYDISIVQDTSNNDASDIIKDVNQTNVQRISSEVDGLGDDKLVQNLSHVDEKHSQDTNANIIGMDSIDKLVEDKINSELAVTEELSLPQTDDQDISKPKMGYNFLTQESMITNDPYSSQGSVSDVSGTEDPLVMEDIPLIGDISLARESSLTGSPPLIIQRPKTLDVLEGQDAILEVRVTGYPEPIVRWFKDGIEVGNDGRTMIEQDGDMWMLTIEGVVQEDDGKYLCKVQNEFGQDTASAIIYVEPLTDNERNLVSDEEVLSDQADMRFRVDDEDEEDGEQQHAESSDVDLFLHGDSSIVGDLVDEISNDDVFKQRHTEIPADHKVSKPEKHDYKESSEPSSVHQADCTDVIDNNHQDNDEQDTSDASSPNYHVPARSKLLSAQHLLGDVDEEKSQNNMSEVETIVDDDSNKTLYVAFADYKPSPGSKENIPLVEGQEVEVLDSENSIQWLVRTQDKTTKETRQGWVPTSHLVPHSRNRSDTGGFRQSRKINVSDYVKLDETLSRKEIDSLIKRGLCIKELLQGEREYVRDLAYCINHFIPPVTHPNVPAYLKGKKDIIFCNIKDIHQFHSDKFLKELEMCENDADSIGKAFINFAEVFDNLYVLYCQNMNATVKNEMTQQVKEFFAVYGGRKGRGEMDIQSYLIKPVQRISRYKLIIKDLIKYTVRANQDCRHLQAACNVMTEVPKKADNMITINQIEGFRGDIKTLGKLHRGDEFNVWHGRSSRGRSKHRMVFLFDEMLMFTKVKKVNETTKNHKDSLFDAGYVYKSHIVIPGIQVQKVANDDKKLDVCNNRPHSVQKLLQGANSYVIRAWEKEILDLAETAQLEGRKPVIIKNRAHSLIRRGSHHGSVHSSFRSMTGSLSSYNASDTGSITLPIVGGNRFSTSSDILADQHDQSSNRSSFVSYVGNDSASDKDKSAPEYGDLYEIQHNVIATGVEGLEFSKGDIVKVLDECDEDKNAFHIETIPTQSFPFTKDGYIPKEYLKKIENEEEIESAPDITVRAKSRTVTIGDTATFICQFIGNPNPQADWNIPENRMLDSRFEVNTTRGVTTLVIYDAKKKDEREYTCTLSNRLGCVSCSATLKVIDSSSPRLAPMNMNSNHAPDKPKSLHRKLTHPLGLFHKTPNSDLSNTMNSGDETVKPLTVNSFDITASKFESMSKAEEIICKNGSEHRTKCNSTKTKKRLDSRNMSDKSETRNNMPVMLDYSTPFKSLHSDENNSTMMNKSKQRHSSTSMFKSINPNVRENSTCVCNSSMPCPDREFEPMTTHNSASEATNMCKSTIPSHCKGFEPCTAYNSNMPYCGFEPLATSKSILPYQGFEPLTNSNSTLPYNSATLTDTTVYKTDCKSCFEPNKSSINLCNKTEIAISRCYDMDTTNNQNGTESKSSSPSLHDQNSAINVQYDISKPEFVNMNIIADSKEQYQLFDCINQIICAIIEDNHSMIKEQVCAEIGCVGKMTLAKKSCSKEKTWQRGGTCWTQARQYYCHSDATKLADRLLCEPLAICAF